MTQNSITTQDELTEFLLYSTPNGDVKVEVFLHNETIWLPQKRIAELFGVNIATINEHLKNIYSSQELDAESTIRKFLIVQNEGSREVKRNISFYNLDAILSVGYRVNSSQATQFRIWATRVLKEKFLFDKWNIQKQKINFITSSKKNFYKEGQIRWVYFGKNIKSEIFGKSDVFSRPALVFKKIYGHSSLVIPLTSQDKTGNYYFSFEDIKRKRHCAIFSQIRYVDEKRIGGKMGSVSKKTFKEIEENFIKFIKNIPT